MDYRTMSLIEVLTFVVVVLIWLQVIGVITIGT
jgi:hypothetical protein